MTENFMRDTIREAMLNQYPRRDVAYIATANGVTLIDRRQARVVDLDSLGALIWLGIDGLHTLAEIADHIAERYNQPEGDIRAMVEQKCRKLVEEGFVIMANAPTALPYHVSMPRDQQDRDEMARSMREAGWIK
jgi:hypothetical protein